MLTVRRGGIGFQTHAQGPGGPVPKVLSSGESHGASFVAGTWVHARDGLKPIESIQVGDEVLSRPDSGVGEPCYKRVLRTFRRDGEEVWLLDVVTADGDEQVSLVCTANHAFWVKGVGWTALADLEPGDDLERVDSRGRPAPCFVLRVLRILATDHEHMGWAGDSFSRDFDGPTIDLRHGRVAVSALQDDARNAAAEAGGVPLRHAVFNIEVEDFPTYFVGEAGVWVHCCADRAVSRARAG
ncbi:polymorphic toxin-type HINT domain-containing protein [Roseateles flavus]|uniref:Polymorphic toxin-type HINT domain-containing protein n=1 Tax=Roseateles flavus TaxID=3149041 RepID=A0ABV0GFB7_9BURK